VNNTLGPGIFLLPVLFHESGWFFPTTAILVLSFISYLTSCCLAEAISHKPGNNADFIKRVESGTLVMHYFGKVGGVFTLFCLVVGVMALDVAAIVTQVLA